MVVRLGPRGLGDWLLLSKLLVGDRGGREGRAVAEA